MTALAPTSAPRVTDNPVLSSAIRPPSNESNCMVVLAASSVENTTTVALELSGSLKVDSNWASSKSTLGVAYTIYARNSSSNCAAVESATPSTTCVRVRSTAHLTTNLLNVLESLGCPSTLAPSVSSGAVNHLLLR